MGTTAAARMLLQGIAFSEDTPPDDNKDSLCYDATDLGFTLNWGADVPFFPLWKGSDTNS